MWMQLFKVGRTQTLSKTVFPTLKQRMSDANANANANANVKPRNERLLETVTILKKLQKLGIPITNTGYIEIKKLMTKWVNSKESFKETIYIARYGREADLVLPDKVGEVATLNLRVLPGLKDSDFAPRENQ